MRDFLNRMLNDFIDTGYEKEDLSVIEEKRKANGEKTVIIWDKASNKKLAEVDFSKSDSFLHCRLLYTDS